MILAGPEIARAVWRGEIVIKPFAKENLEPNSYRVTLGDSVLGCRGTLSRLTGYILTGLRPIPTGMSWPARVGVVRELDVTDVFSPANVGDVEFTARS